MNPTAEVKSENKIREKSILKNRKLDAAFYIISAVTFIYFVIQEIISPAVFSFKVFWFFVSLIFFFLAKFEKNFSRKIKVNVNSDFHQKISRYPLV